MIRRLYVDNFRSLVDFTWEPGKETLVLGYNGSGKSSALEVLRILQDVCAGSGRLDLDVEPEDRTSWQDKPAVIFEIEALTEVGVYIYRLEIAFPSSREWPNVASETLVLDGRRLLVRKGQGAQVAQTDSTLGPVFPINIHQSAIAAIGREFGGENIVPFRDCLGDIVYLKPSPFLLYAHKTGTVVKPEESLSDVVPWYLHLKETLGFTKTLVESLRGVWPDLVQIDTPEFSPNVYDFVLQVKSETNDSTLSVPLRALSDGERILIGLYILATYQQSSPPSTIVIDEPDNFVSLLELQPWLQTLLDTRPDDGQIILVSHNPEIIQTMGEEKVAWFSRKDHLSPTRVSSIPPDRSGLSLTERLARGWIVA